MGFFMQRDFPEDGHLEMWFGDFIEGRKSIESHDWVAELCEQVLCQTGMPEGDAKALGRRLQADMEGLLVAREQARGALNQLAWLDEHDAWREFNAREQRASKGLTPEQASPMVNAKKTDEADRGHAPD